MRRALVPLAVVGVALLVALPVWYATAPPAMKAKVGQPAPDFALPHHHQPESRGTLSQLRGSPVLLVRFDSRWPGTPEYLVELERIHRRYLRDGLVVVGVALDEAAEQRAMQWMLANRNVSFTVLVDPEGTVTNALYGAPQGKAVSYVIDAAGTLLEVRRDLPQWTSGPLRERLSALLPTRTPTPVPGGRPIDTPPAGQ